MKRMKTCSCPMRDERRNNKNRNWNDAWVKEEKKSRKKLLTSGTGTSKRMRSRTEKPKTMRKKSMDRGNKRKSIGLNNTVEVGFHQIPFLFLKVQNLSQTSFLSRADDQQQHAQGHEDQERKGDEQNDAEKGEDEKAEDGEQEEGKGEHGEEGGAEQEAQHQEPDENIDLGDLQLDEGESKLEEEEQQEEEIAEGSKEEVSRICVSGYPEGPVILSVFVLFPPMVSCRSRWKSMKRRTPAKQPGMKMKEAKKT